MRGLGLLTKDSLEIDRPRGEKRIVKGQKMKLRNTTNWSGKMWSASPTHQKLTGRSGLNRVLPIHPLYTHTHARALECRWLLDVI